MSGGIWSHQFFRDNSSRIWWLFQGPGVREQQEHISLDFWLIACCVGEQLCSEQSRERVGTVRCRQAPDSELKERIFEKRRKRLKNPMGRLQELRSTVPFKSNWKAICLTCYFMSCPVCILSVCIQKQGVKPCFPVWICHQGCPAWMLGQLAALAPLLQKWAWGSQCTEQTAEWSAIVWASCISVWQIWVSRMRTRKAEHEQQECSKAKLECIWIAPAEKVSETSSCWERVKRTNERSVKDAMCRPQLQSDFLVSLSPDFLHSLILNSGED